MKFSIFLGDIADAPADAVCTSTNPRLSLMMGTGASVRGRGGPAILRACEAVAPLPPGSVHATTAGELPFKLVLHCVASDAAHHSSIAIVQACVTNALARADSAGCKSIAMPVFGTGHAHLRFDDAVRAMVVSAREARTSICALAFVTNDEERVDDLRAVLGKRIEVVRSPNLEDQHVSFWSDEYELDLPR